MTDMQHRKGLKESTHMAKSYVMPNNPSVCNLMGCITICSILFYAMFLFHPVLLHLRKEETINKPHFFLR